MTRPNKGCCASRTHQAKAVWPSCWLAATTQVATVAPDVSLRMNRLRPLINLPPSKPTFSVAVAEFLTLCESRMRVVGSAFFFHLPDIFRGNPPSDRHLRSPTLLPCPTWQSRNARCSSKGIRRANRASRTRFSGCTGCRSPPLPTAICCADAPESRARYAPSPQGANQMCTF